MICFWSFGKHLAGLCRKSERDQKNLWFDPTGLFLDYYLGKGHAASPDKLHMQSQSNRAPLQHPITCTGPLSLVPTCQQSAVQVDMRLAH